MSAVEPKPELTVGAVECQLVYDGHWGLPPELLLANAAAEARESAVAGFLDASGRVPVVFNALLIRTRDTVALVDAGLGQLPDPFDGEAGHILDSLDELGVAPEDVDLVLITHGHPDHIGGLVRDDQVVFQRARHLMSRIEHDFWGSEDERLARLPPEMRDPPAAVFERLRDSGLVELIEAGDEVLPDVRFVAAPGHTPGHMAIEIGGEGGIFFLGDAIVHQLHVEHLDWTLAPDTDPADVLATRSRLLARAVDERRTVTAPHLRGPGWIERDGGGYRLRLSS